MNDLISLVSGMGIITPIGIGLPNFTRELKKGTTNFSYSTLSNEASSVTIPCSTVPSFEYKIEIEKLALSENLKTKAKRLRNISKSTEFGVFCALEAWADAKIDAKENINFERIAIISAGTNLQQATMDETFTKYREKSQFINPNYALSFFDSDIIGIVSELLEIKGEGYSIGSASASGNMALIQGDRLIKSGNYDFVLVVAPLLDPSIFEVQAFHGIGAMAKVNHEKTPEQICCPFDESHAGFVYGQNAGCIILQSSQFPEQSSANLYGSIVGCGVALDGNRNPNPSIDGERRSMEQALKNAKIEPDAINYINSHGTSSPTGDDTEVHAIIAAKLNNAKINSTKSLIGHGLTSAGLVESIACCIQMKGQFLHATNNLKHPINNELDFIKETIQNSKIKYALNNSFGFGGVNTSILFANLN